MSDKVYLFYRIQYISNEIHDLALEWEKKQKEEPNVHDTKIFKEKMKKANDNGINVVSQLSSDETHKVDNIRARYVLEHIIGEDENQDTEILKGKQNLLFHNKKTGHGFFIHFD